MFANSQTPLNLSTFGGINKPISLCKNVNVHQNLKLNIIASAQAVSFLERCYNNKGCKKISNLLSSYCKIRLWPFKGVQMHLKCNNLDMEESELLEIFTRYHVGTYTVPFKISFSVPEEMLLLPAWWIQLREHTAFRLSLSISTAQDTTVKTNVTENRDSERALSRVVTLSDLIITLL